MVSTHLKHISEIESFPQASGWHKEIADRNHRIVNRGPFPMSLFSLTLGRSCVTLTKLKTLGKNGLSSLEFSKVCKVFAGSTWFVHFSPIFLWNHRRIETLNNYFWMLPKTLPTSMFLGKLFPSLNCLGKIWGGNFHFFQGVPRLANGDLATTCCAGTVKA